MKSIKVIFASLLLFQTMFSADEFSWIDTQIDAIKLPRIGINNSQMLNIKDPFISYKKTQNQQPNSEVKQTSIKKSNNASIKLSAIINNSALINGVWYKLNQSIEGFIISTITKTTVILIKGDKKLVLTTKDQNKNIKFKQGRIEE